MENIYKLDLKNINCDGDLLACMSAELFKLFSDSNKMETIKAVDVKNIPHDLLISAAFNSALQKMYEEKLDTDKVLKLEWLTTYEFQAANIKAYIKIFEPYSEKHLFQIPIGDWSNDGHKMCEWYTIQSNLPMSKVYKAYFKSKKELPPLIHPDNICAEYEENNIEDDVLAALKKHGCNVKIKDKTWLNPKELLLILLWFIEQGDKSLRLGISNIPRFINWEAPKGKSLEQFGYGLFRD